MEELLDEIAPGKKKTLHFYRGIILIWFLIFALAYVFKFMHWPFGDLLRIIGSGGFMAYALSLLLLIDKRNMSLIACNILSLLWIVTILIGAFLKNDFPLNFAGLTVLGIVFGVLFTLHFVIFLIIKTVRRSK